MSANKKTSAVPKFKDRKFVKPLLCAPGPCDLWPSVTKPLSRPTLTPSCDELYNVLDEIRAGIQYLFQTESKCVLAVSGSGHCGMETVITNLVAPGETLLIASRGVWDQRALNVANRHGITTIVTEVPINATFSLEYLESELKRVRPTALFITHGDSSNGTLQKIEGLGEICHKYDTLLLLDAVVSIPGVPFYMDEWQVDGVYTSTQKALSGPPGISPVGFSTRAQNKIYSRTHQPPFYFDIKLLADQWNCYGNTRKYHHTLSSPLLWALRACLQELAKETLEKCWERHARVTAYFHQRLQEQGFQFFVTKPEDRLTTATTITLPKGYDYQQFSNYMREKHNIYVQPGLGPSAGKALRIGNMGVNSTTEIANAIVDAMMATMIGLKKCSL
ncbi:hypothetical protein O0L34_g5963 [Tuta absoluta]|nr:hypothetical protein O0L34_g5963 [Tuta absoluta]